MSSNVKLGFGVGLLVLAVIVVIQSASVSTLPPLALDLHSQVGHAMAVEVSHQLSGEGSVVIIKPEAPFDMPLVEAQLEAFRKELSSKKIKIVAEEVIRLERLGSLDGMLTPSLFENVIAKYTAADAVVSFVGLGDFPKKKERLPNTPALFVISPNVDVPWSLIDSKFVAAALIPRWIETKESTEQTIDVHTNDFSRKFEIVPATSESRP